MATEDWACRPQSVTDGDTIRAHLQRELSVINGWALTVHSTDTRGVPLRLTIIDTPERGQPGYQEAKADLTAWLSSHLGRLRCETYESGGWDRLLADIYVDGDRGNTATQHLMQLGWDPYVG